jgi:hypothetical protein
VAIFKKKRNGREKESNVGEDMKKNWSPSVLLMGT